MIKKISDMTAADRAAFLESIKKTTLKQYGIPWSFMEEKILKDIDDSFDDEKFLKMDPDFRVDAALLRRKFNDKKPDLIDYLLWAGEYVTDSEYVSW